MNATTFDANQVEEKFREVAGDPVSRCPHCGEKSMFKDDAFNALSRYQSLYICRDCGTEEGFNDYLRQPK